MQTNQRRGGVDPAPLPKVNPWQANANAAQVITSKVTVVTGTTTVGGKNQSQPRAVLPHPPSSPGPKPWKTAVANSTQSQKAAAAAPASSASVDWPTLGEATGIETEAPQPQPPQSKAVRFRSNTTDSTDSGSEDIQLNAPSSSANGPPAPPLLQSNDTDGQASGSSEENDEGGPGGPRRVSKSKKASKQKWVPLEIPETANGTAAQGPAKGRGPPRRSASSRSSAQGVRGGAGRGGGGVGGAPRGRKPYRGGRGSTQSPDLSGGSGGAPLSPVTTPVVVNGQEENYADFPSDFTTLVPMYPAVTEFVMPYVWNGYLPTAAPPATAPAAAAVVKDAQVASAYGPPPVDKIIIAEMVRKQIEYYFSEENLEKDFFLRRKMDEQGFLPVHLIATFPRVKNMTQDYSAVLAAIQSSPSLELNADMSMVRVKNEPEKWPLRDIATAPAPNASGFGNPSGVGSGGEEILNPNVPEFIPKRVSLTIPEAQDDEDDIEGEKEPEAGKTEQEPELEKLVLKKSNVDVDELEESWREVKKKPKPVVNKEKKRSSLSFSEVSSAVFRTEELAFQFEEEAADGCESILPAAATSLLVDIRYKLWFHFSWTEDSDYEDDELSDSEIDKIVIFTQKTTTRPETAVTVHVSPPNRPPKHEGYDRTGNWTKTRTKITQELAQVINDGLHYYEDDLVGVEGTSAHQSL
ncbi:La-related protein 1 [Orchesella cincta]|uniref:La-related protein 1 n=1 Tax=Orchesella cincta TaxID=48709 RepID=A0A1D2MKM5_ORCCI|nr:La-related protein 1 [Orchesella cincta]